MEARSVNSFPCKYRFETSGNSSLNVQFWINETRYVRVLFEAYQIQFHTNKASLLHHMWLISVVGGTISQMISRYLKTSLSFSHGQSKMLALDYGANLRYPILPPSSHFRFTLTKNATCIALRPSTTQSSSTFSSSSSSLWCGFCGGLVVALVSYFVFASYGASLCSISPSTNPKDHLNLRLRRNWKKI